MITIAASEMAWVGRVEKARGKAVLLAVLSATTPARSQHESVAESLFREARDEMKRGQPAEACPKLEESYRLDPAIGTLLNLALCEEALGHTATAWTKLRQFMDSAPAGDRRLPLAREKLADLEAELPWVRLVLDGGDDRAIVQLDDVELRTASLNQAMAVNPGEHLVRVIRLTGESTERRFRIRPAEKLELRVWAPAQLTPAVSSASSAPVVPHTDRLTRRAPALANPSPRPDGRSGERVLAYGLGAIGLAGLATGGVFGALALRDRNTVRSECPNHDCENQAGLDAAESGAQKVKIANIAFVTGALGLVTSGVLFWHSGRATTAVSLTPHSASLCVVGLIQ